MEVLGIVIIIVIIFFLGVFIGATLEDIEDLLSFIATVFIALIAGFLFFFLALDISSFFL
jgi:hypothetical protein